MKFNKISSLLLGLVLVLGLGSCKPKDPVDPEPTHIDYASELKLDMNSSSKKLEVSLLRCIDGDTTHFNWNLSADGTLKTRYLGIDTPESTGKIQPWGKQASKFNSERLNNAVSIVVESNDENWNVDSTGGRYLVFVWYKLNANDDYKCLNLEILQEGLAGGKNIGATKYATVFSNAQAQAMREQLRYYGNDKDPLYDYSGYSEVTIKEIREYIVGTQAGTIDTTAEDYIDYNGKNVRVECTVVYMGGSTYFVADYDGEDNRWYGLTVYPGYNTYDPLVVGNRLSLAGTISYSEGFGYQLSGLAYYPLMPKAAGNMRLIEENIAVNPQEVLASAANSDKMLVDTYVTVKELTVERVYTTESTTASNGAMTLTCKDRNNNTIKVRTEVLYEVDEQGNVVYEEVTYEYEGKMVTGSFPKKVTAEKFEGKTIDVTGIIEEYNDSTQIHVYGISEINIYK